MVGRRRVLALDFTGGKVKLVWGSEYFHPVTFTAVTCNSKQTHPGLSAVDRFFGPSRSRVPAEDRCFDTSPVTCRVDAPYSAASCPLRSLLPPPEGELFPEMDWRVHAPLFFFSRLRGMSAHHFVGMIRLSSLVERAGLK